ncbi:MAG TPA: ThuA domain-containing protein [Luteitalea sp.]|nr:ThuA domain-containing protein [Luteitalea sp.]
MTTRYRSATGARWAFSIAAMAVALFTTAPAAQQASAAKPLRALYVTGGGFHDFVTQEGIVPPGIASRVNVEWTIDNTAGKATDVMIERHKDTAWTKSFDVVVYNMSFSHVVDPTWIERITTAHRESGVGAVILHGAVHSYRRSTSKAWGQLMGAFSMRHDKQKPITVKALAPANPIMKGVPASWTTINEELYEIIETFPGMTPLAEAHSTEVNKTSPVIWTNQAGKARVFVTSLGHNNEMMSDPVYLGLVSRGLLWTAGKLNDDGTPVKGYGRP